MVFDIVNDILALLIPVLVAALVELVRRKIKAEQLQYIALQMEQKKALAILAVKFVEQTYRGLHGEEKYNEAAKWLSERSAEYGIKISDVEIKGLIEAALREIKDHFGEHWSQLESGN